jgi:hypothetical protein
VGQFYSLEGYSVSPQVQISDGDSIGIAYKNEEKKLEFYLNKKFYFRVVVGERTEEEKEKEKLEMGERRRKWRERGGGNGRMEEGEDCYDRKDFIRHESKELSENFREKFPEGFEKVVDSSDFLTDREIWPFVEIHGSDAVELLPNGVSNYGEDHVFILPASEWFY